MAGPGPVNYDVFGALSPPSPTSARCQDEAKKTEMGSDAMAEKEENDVLVHNLSSTELTPEQLKVLSHEACFNTTDTDPVNLVATVESILKQTEESDEKNTSFGNRAKQDALKKVRADTSIVVLPADKRRSTVVLDMTDYIQKATNLLGDRQAYFRCDDEPM
ncbi:hypothetical protein SprV_0301147500 [Sparganum proliferum]